MLTLAFESSAKAASVALCEDGRLISQVIQCSGLTHSRTLLPMAEDLLKNAEMEMKQIDCFAVAQGPGSFTGIRIGIATVKGLAWAADKPCIGVSTLAAMAWNGVAAGGRQTLRSLQCPLPDRGRQTRPAVPGPGDQSFRADGRTAGEGGSALPGGRRYGAGLGFLPGAAS